MNRLLGSVAVLAAVGLAVPPALAYMAKARRQREGALPFDEDADELDLAVIFDPLQARSQATAFRGGEVLAWYGGGTLDLRDATLDPAGATLRIRAIFGGLEIIVPETWPVEVHSSSVFGGVGNATDPATTDPSSPTLILDILSVFGGTAILSKPQAPEPILVGASRD
jgi:predicted membrane protein